MASLSTSRRSSSAARDAGGASGRKRARSVTREGPVTEPAAKTPRRSSDVARMPMKPSEQGSCRRCAAKSSNQWRRGPDGKGTLCNACGLQYGVLVRGEASQLVISVWYKDTTITPGKEEVRRELKNDGRTRASADKPAVTRAVASKTTRKSTATTSRRASHRRASAKTTQADSAASVVPGSAGSSSVPRRASTSTAAAAAGTASTGSSVPSTPALEQPRESSLDVLAARAVAIKLLREAAHRRRSADSVSVAVFGEPLSSSSSSSPSSASEPEQEQGGEVVENPPASPDLPSNVTASSLSSSSPRVRRKSGLKRRRSAAAHDAGAGSATESEPEETPPVRPARVRRPPALLLPATASWPKPARRRSSTGPPSRARRVSSAAALAAISGAESSDGDDVGADRASRTQQRRRSRRDASASALTTAQARATPTHLQPGERGSDESDLVKKLRGLIDKQQHRLRTMKSLHKSLLENWDARTMTVRIDELLLTKLQLALNATRDPMLTSSSLAGAATIPRWYPPHWRPDSMSQFHTHPGQQNKVSRELVRRLARQGGSYAAVVSVTPTGYQHIDRNVFVHRAPVRGYVTQRCQCEDTAVSRVVCGDGCLNRMLFIECDDEHHDGVDCGNKRFQKQELAPMHVVSIPFKGYGVVADSPLSEGDFICEFAGEVVSTSELTERRRGWANGDKHYYLMATQRDEYVDASRKGNVGRLLNHSCDANCETTKWTVNGEICVGIIARRDIKEGEELTFNYNYQRINNRTLELCHCGAECCSGFLGGDLDSCALEDMLRDSDNDNDDADGVGDDGDGDDETGRGNRAFAGALRALRRQRRRYFYHHDDVEEDGEERRLPEALMDVPMWRQSLMATIAHRQRHTPDRLAYVLFTSDKPSDAQGVGKKDGKSSSMSKEKALRFGLGGGSASQRYERAYGGGIARAPPPTTVVWSRMRGFPYWPSLVCDPADWHKFGVPRQPKAHPILIYFFGSYDFKWMSVDTVDVRFRSNFREHVNHVRSKKVGYRKAFMAGVREALHYIKTGDVKTFRHDSIDVPDKAPAGDDSEVLQIVGNASDAGASDSGAGEESRESSGRATSSASTSPPLLVPQSGVRLPHGIGAATVPAKVVLEDSREDIDNMRCVGASSSDEESDDDADDELDPWMDDVRGAPTDTESDSGDV